MEFLHEHQRFFFLFSIPFSHSIHPSTLNKNLLFQFLMSSYMKIFASFLYLCLLHKIQLNKGHNRGRKKLYVFVTLIVQCRQKIKKQNRKKEKQTNINIIKNIISNRIFFHKNANKKKRKMENYAVMCFNLLLT